MILFFLSYGKLLWMNFFWQCGQKWLVIVLKIVFNFAYQSEEEAGSAGEQPASNKIDAITIKKELIYSAPFIFIG